MVIKVSPAGAEKCDNFSCFLYSFLETSIQSSVLLRFRVSDQVIRSCCCLARAQTQHKNNVWWMWFQSYSLNIWRFHLANGVIGKFFRKFYNISLILEYVSAVAIQLKLNLIELACIIYGEWFNFIYLK